MGAKWKSISWGECDQCGNDVEVKSENLKQDYVYDGEEVRCADSECENIGVTCCDGEGGAYIQWKY